MYGRDVLTDEAIGLGIQGRPFVHEYIGSDSTGYFMEKIDGDFEDLLAKFIEAQRWPIQSQDQNEYLHHIALSTLDVLIQISLLVRYFWERFELKHEDLKPENILVHTRYYGRNKFYDACLADFEFSYMTVANEKGETVTIEPETPSTYADASTELTRFFYENEARLRVIVPPIHSVYATLRATDINTKSMNIVITNSIITDLATMREWVISNWRNKQKFPSMPYEILPKLIQNIDDPEYMKEYFGDKANPEAQWIRHQNGWLCKLIRHMGDWSEEGATWPHAGSHECVAWMDAAWLFAKTHYRQYKASLWNVLRNSSSELLTRMCCLKLLSNWKGIFPMKFSYFDFSYHYDTSDEDARMYVDTLKKCSQTKELERDANRILADMVYHDDVVSRASGQSGGARDLSAYCAIATRL